MLSLATQTRIFVYAKQADMRKGIDGLSGIVREEFGADPTDGSLFVFVNRRRDRMKLLHFHEGGFWLYYRVLESGTFEAIEAKEGQPSVTIDGTELQMLLSGVSLIAATRRRARYSLPKPEPSKSTS